MATSARERTSLPPASPWRLAAAVAAPLAGVALAYGLWWISDRLLYIGPLDRATFGWAVVVPVWMLTPFAAALAWRGLDRRATLTAAAIAGATLTAMAAVVYWLAVAFPDCEFGAIRSPAQWILPSIVVGAVIGGGLAAISIGTTSVLRGRNPMGALLLGAGLALVLTFVGIAAAVVFVSPGVGVCLPPPGA